MGESVFHITKDSRLETVSLDDYSRGHEEVKELWVDLKNVDNERVGEVLTLLSFSGIAKTLSLEAEDRQGLSPLRHELFLSIPVLIEGSEESQTTNLAVLFNKGILVSLHSEQVLNAEQLRHLDKSEEWLSDPTVPGLVSSLLLVFTKNLLEETRRLRNSARRCEEKLDRKPEELEAEEIIELRTQLSSLVWVNSEQTPALEGLLALDHAFFQSSASSANLQSAVINLRAAERILSMMDNQINALRSGFQMHAQDRANSRLGMLTILSAIFMPITLLAGIWGMNFEHMPELTIPFAYPLALLLMGSIGVVMFIFFRRRGWFN